MSGIADFAESESEDSLVLKVMCVEYTESDSGTTVHLFGRDSDGERHHIEVGGHNPSFYIREAAYSERVDNHYAVDYCETKDVETNEPYETVHSEPLVRVYTHQSSAVSEMRDIFDETWEADVFYDKRWLIDEDIYTGVRIDTSEAVEEDWVRGDMRVDTKAVEPCSLDETPTLDPKKVVLDIEVGGGGSVPDADRAESPVTTICAWDSYSERYVGWVLRSDSWDEEPFFTVSETGCNDVTVFGDESQMLHSFNEWLADQRADIITGWYSNDFDLPYLVNRCRNLNTYNYQDWSPLGDVWISRYEPVVKGVECIDMLGAYQKTQIHKLKKKGLNDIAERELGEGKVEHDLNHTEMWKQSPVEFLRYNKVDVELVHRIDESRGCIEMLDNLRAVSGCSYSAPIGGNIDMMDMVFLRKAQEYGYALPTAVEPEVGSFHGAYVFTPDAGLHEHVVYPDYSSLYPNMMYQCNISPETLVGTAEDLEASEYDEDDCVWTYVDETTPPSLKENVEVTEGRMEKLYFVKPSVEEGFVRKVLDDIMGMCDSYSGSMYDAAKRVRNSTYGVLGDSDSYGSGFRLFDWRLAEGTTLGGQKVLKEGAKQFTDAVSYDDAHIVGGDTDSVMTAMPSAESGEDALESATGAAEDVNEWLDEFCVDTFGLESEDNARMELEIESYASALFFKGDDDGRSEDGVKKRYVQLIEWDDSVGWLDDPSIDIKGFEYVRSDVSSVTAAVQYDTFQTMVQQSEDAESVVKERVRDTIAAVMQGESSHLYSGLEDLGIPFGISQSLSEYGSTDRTPQPQYRGAKFANEFIYGGDAIGEGDKPLYFYVDEGQTGSELRKTYSAHTKEDGTYVDAISVLDADDLPSDVSVDREKMVTKTVVDPMEAIFRTLGWGTQWLYDAIEDAKEPEDYRDENQRGFEEFAAEDYM